MPPRSDDRGIRELLEALPREQPPDTLRERLGADIEARFSEAGVGQAASLPIRLLRSRPALASAALIAVACVAVALLSTRSDDVFGDTLAAMAKVKTAHIEGHPYNIWLSVDHGVRREEGPRISIFTTEATWDYDPQANTVTISDGDANAVQALLMEFSGLSWIEHMRRDRTAHSISDVLLDGRPAKRVDAASERGENGGTLWIDSETMLVVQAEKWHMKSGERVVRARFRIQYDVEVDPALFRFEPPAGAKVMDCRFDESTRTLIQAAAEAVRTLPLHQVGEETPLYVNEGRRWDERHAWEAWWQNGIDYREEYDYGTVYGGTPEVEWQYTDRDGSIRDPWLHPECQPPILGWLESLPRAGSEGQVTDRKPLEVTREERNGRPFVRIARYRTYYHPPDKGARLSERERHEYLFDAEARRLVESSVYVLVDDDWKLAEHVKYDYPKQLPEGIFEPVPPPGVEMRDCRKR